MNKELYLKKIISDLKMLAKQVSVINEINIFGSYAKGNPSDSSDLDVVVLCDDNSAYDDIIKKIFELTQKYNKFVHPVIYDKPKHFLLDNIYIKTNIFDNSILVYKRDGG